MRFSKAVVRGRVAILILTVLLRSADISREMLFVWHFSSIWLSESC